MTPEQQRIAIATACGWKKEYIHGNGVDDEVWIHPVTQKCWLAELAPLPDYLNDLNAMHEAEKVMTDKQKENYPINLARVIRHQLGIDDGKSIYHWKFSTFATAAQRAEAFLKTLSLWTEE